MGSGDEESLFRLFDEMAVQGLRVSADLPQFEMIIIKNKGPYYSAAVFRINHSIGDGISLSKMISYVDRRGCGVVSSMEDSNLLMPRCLIHQGDLQGEGWRPFASS